MWVWAFCDRDGFVFRSLDGQATLYYCITEREEKERKEKEKRERRRKEEEGARARVNDCNEWTRSHTQPGAERSQTCWANFF